MSKITQNKKHLNGTKPGCQHFFVYFEYLSKILFSTNGHQASHLMIYFFLTLLMSKITQNKKHDNATKPDFQLINVTKGHNSTKYVQIAKHRKYLAKHLMTQPL